MPRFAILDHDHPFQHWDFFLEAGDVLRGWRLLEEPTAVRPIVAEALSDHRKLYLDYEGPVSANRGRVNRWDAGTYTLQTDTAEVVRVYLEGARVSGVVTMRRSTDANWEWIWS